MPNVVPTMRKAFLATRNPGSGVFLLTERFDSPDGKILFLIIESSSEKIGRNIQNILQSNLVKNFLATPNYSISDLEKSLHYINQKIEPISPNQKLNSIVGIVESNLIHLSMIGNIEGYLLRKGKINSVTEGLGNEDEVGFINITSGELIVNDLVIIGNRNLFDSLSLDRIRRTLTQSEPIQAITDFYSILRKAKRVDCNAIVLQASEPGAENEIDPDNPEILYLDEIIESKFSKFYKKAKPVIREYYLKGSDLALKLVDSSKSIAKRSSLTVKERYAPKTKDLLITTNSKAIEGFSKFSDNIKGRKGVKVRPYAKKASWLSTLPSYLYRCLQFILRKENRRYLYIILILVLVFTAYFKIKSNNQNRDVIKQQNDSAFAYDQAVDAFNSAQNTINSGQSGGAEQLGEALQKANIAYSSVSTKDKAVELIRQINDSLDKLINMKRAYGLSPVLSFKYDISVSAIAGSTLYGATEDGKIYMADTRENNPKLIGAIDSSLGEPISASYSDSTNILYVLTNQNKIWAYDPQMENGGEVALSDGNQWESAQAVSTYSTSIYLLDGTSGKIWRHTKSGSGFGPGTAYLGKNNTDAENGISLAIDGSIYMLKSTGVISKFSHGALDSGFSIQSPPKPTDTILDASKVYTDADSQFIYILDEGNNRIVSFAKDGQFNNQYAIDQITISQFLINSRIQKMWVISGKDVYELDL